MILKWFRDHSKILVWDFFGGVEEFLRKWRPFLESTGMKVGCRKHRVIKAGLQGADVKRGVATLSRGKKGGATRSRYIKAQEHQAVMRQKDAN